MNLLKENIKKIYFKYLVAAFGSSLISTIYGFVDMVVIGRYEGPLGSAAMAVISPIWNIIYSLGLLLGIGGSVYFSNIKASNNGEKENEYFTLASYGAIILSIISTIIFIFFDKEILMIFGASEDMIPLCQQYLLPIKFVIPTYLLSQVLASFLRNDGNPSLATIAVLSGGIFNVFGDVFLTFTLDLGMFGAGLATAIGNCIAVIVMCLHFIGKKNTLRFIKINHLLKKSKNIIIAGFSTFFIDVSMGIVTALVNNQIKRYSGDNALAVYGVIVYINTFVQCCGYSVGQAAQPIISSNLGAKQPARVKLTMRYAIISSIVFGIALTSLSMLFPKQIIKLVMNPTTEVLKLAPKIMCIYSLGFILLPLNVFTTYYFQALMKPTTSFLISVTRGAILSGILIMLLPALIGEIGLWLALPIMELIVCFIAIYFTIKYTKKLSFMN